MAGHKIKTYSLLTGEINEYKSRRNFIASTEFGCGVLNQVIGDIGVIKRDMAISTKENFNNYINSIRETIDIYTNGRIYDEIPSYLFLSDGRIFSRYYGFFVEKSYCRNGYEKLTTQANGKSKNFLVHRIIAKLFIPNPENKPEVNHIDGNKKNNSMNNLEWCTRSENGLHKYRILMSKHPMVGVLGINNKKSKIVYAYKNGICVDSFFGLSDASRKTGISSGHISQVCNGIRSIAGGYVWKF